jgi:hypothetical protein
VKQLFDEVVGTPPPSDLDVRALIRRERSRSRRNRGALGLVALAAAVALPVALPAALPAAHLDQPAPPTFQLVVGSQQAAAATAKQVRAALDAGLDTVGARWREAPEELLEWAGDRFSGSGAVTADGREGDLRLDIVSDYDPCPPGSSPDKACGEDQPSKTAALLTCAETVGACTEGTSPSGRRMVTTEDSTSPPGAGATFRSVTVSVELGEEWVLAVNASNTDAKTARQPEPVLDARQLATVALEVADRIVP